MRRRAVQSSAADAVDVALEIAAVEQLSQHKLLEGGDGTGVKAQLFIESLHHGWRENHVADSDGGGNGFGEGIHIDNIHALCHGKKGAFRLAGHGEL